MTSQSKQPDQPVQPAQPDQPVQPDQTERVILRTAQEEAAATGATAVIDDPTGALLAGALERGPVIAWSASRARTLALAEQFAEPLAAGTLRVLGLQDGPAGLGAESAGFDRGIDLVLMRLPKSLAALDARARDLAAAFPGAVLVGGARTKHMTRSQNEVLEACCEEVRASRGLGKSRALVARGLRAGTDPAPVAEGIARVAVLGSPAELALRAVGGVFGGAVADAGSLLLLEALDAAHAEGAAPALEGTAPRVLDLGSGNGLLAAHTALAVPGAQVLATDDDADAVRSSRLTLAANGLAGEATWDDAASAVPAGSVDAVLLNPPFHDGTAIDATLVHGLLDAAARVLRPGGELWFVHNSHLRYRTELERRVGMTEQRARDRRFTVLRALRD